MKKLIIFLIAIYAVFLTSGAYASQECLKCHKLEWDSFSLTRHSKNTDCSGCHGDTKKHLTESTKKGNILIPAALPIKKSNAICLNCHEDRGKNISDRFSTISDVHNELECYKCHRPHLLNSSSQKDLDSFNGDLSVDCAMCHSQETDDLSDSPHGSADIKCTDCHKIHQGQTVSETIENQINTCLSCHPTVEMDFKYPYPHPLREKQITCSSCHSPHSSRYDKMLKKGGDKVCGNCHADVIIDGGKHPLRKGTDHPFNTVKCMACHRPHGSNFDNILKYNENSICKACHN